MRNFQVNLNSFLGSTDVYVFLFTEVELAIAYINNAGIYAA